MPRFIAAASPRRTDERPRRSARRQLAVLAIAITAALTTVIGHSLPAEAAEHPVSAATAVHARAASAAAPTSAVTAPASAAGGTSTAYTPSGAEAADPHQIGASARSFGWNWHGGF